MVACGPFTVNNELSYPALKDLMAAVERDQPHALILAGPFINQNHEDIQNGDLKYWNSDTHDFEYLDYDQLFDELINFIFQKLGHLKQKTQVIIVPSHNDIVQMYPLPQPHFDKSYFNSKKLGASPHLVGNPSVFMLNDISVGVVNVDVVKDMCLNICTKFEVSEQNKIDQNLSAVGVVKQRPSDATLAKMKAPPKIDQVLYSLLEQRSFYPLCPAGMNSPVEVEQVKKFMFEKTPDILITPSDLTIFAKNISGCICVNPGTMCKGSTGGTFATITVDPLVIASQGLDLQGNLKDQKMSNRAQERIRVDINNI